MPTDRQSLCETCGMVRVILTPRQSRFLLCEKSLNDPAYPKYPPQPVVACRGYESGGAEAESST